MDSEALIHVDGLPKWVGSGRVTFRHVSPILPLEPYVRLSPHTAHERRTFTGSFYFANSTVFPMVSLRVRWLPLYYFPTLSLRAFAMCAAFPRSDYYAQYDCLWGLGVSSPSGSPVFNK
jgi:hypothetical protein